MRQSLIRLFILAILACPSLLHAANSMEAPNEFRIAAVVNEQVITTEDLYQRLKLAEVMGGLPDDPELRKRLLPQLMQKLIDEALQRKIANDRKVKVDRERLSEGMQRIAQSQNMTLSEMGQMLASQGASLDAMRAQLEAELLWSNVISNNIRSKTEVLDSDIDNVLEAVSGPQGYDEWQLHEIFLPVGSPEQESDARELAEELIESIQEDGTPFLQVAAQFPGLQATVGEGELTQANWVKETELDPAIVDALMLMRRGDISAPVRTAQGYHILTLVDKRRMVAADPSETEVALRQIILPVAPDAPKTEIQAQLAQAGQLKGWIRGCRDFLAKGQTIPGANAHALGRLQLRQLHPEVRRVVDTLELGKISEPFRTPLGVHLMIMCERIQARSTAINRDEIKGQLLKQKVLLEALRTLRNERRNAFIDIRL